MQYQIRQAKLDDIPTLCEHLMAFSKFYKTNLPPYKDFETSERVLTNFIKDHLFFVSELGDDIVGFICGLIYPHIYNPDILTLTEAFWWVDPGHRKGGAGKMLLDAYEEWGKDNVDWILMTIEDETPIDESVFLNRGYRKKETNFIMEVN